ncbi:ABC transporter ATP-binding protein [Acrocarpospora macrocephala]|uniref:ABC transporter ATP-binding protein n=1 Tax=Acrocarpospora macrocephala TaxID=150177 RepID=A0A5M3WZ25_9ACTN|nr:ABC transporter ATP-binding protein [Acrocarpospora macrocephala]GES11298.1 ABC transporter ATP-binding protein [Acrocarpospora macrocephala]
MSEAILRATGLRKEYGSTLALRGADLTVRTGEVVAIMGPSGSGKSTLLHCLAGVITPDQGEVRLDGVPLAGLNDRARSRLRRSSFGFVFQFGQLVPELPAIENIALPLLLAGSKRREAMSVARAWFPRLGLDGLEHRLPGQMSGGQSQRVAVARALAAGPRVVFADEPTGALDSLAGEQVMDLLIDAARTQGATVVLVTHEARVAAHADRTVIVRDGRVTAPVEA